MLNKILSKAKDGENDYIIEFINRFTPLIKKYGKKLYDDGENEIIEFLLTLIPKIPSFDNEWLIVSYVHVSIKNFYIGLIKKQSKFSELISENDNISMGYYKLNTTKWENDFRSIEFLELINKLTLLQQKVIIYIYYYQYTEKFASEKLGVSRQAVNAAKHRALNILKKEIEDTEKTTR